MLQATIIAAPAITQFVARLSVLFKSAAVLHKRRNELIGVLSDSRIIYSPATRRNTEKREEDERLGEGRFDDLFRDIRME